MFRYDLLDNGIDYLAEAVRRLAGEPDTADLKYAVLHLGAGIELILKARLVHESWAADRTLAVPGSAPLGY